MELQFDISDFDKMYLPVHLMPDNVDPTKYFEKISKLPEFVLKIVADKKKEKVRVPIEKQNKVVKWVAYMYDMKSPFRSAVIDVLKRKIEIAKYVKLIEDTKNLDPLVRDMLNGSHEDVNKMAVAYCRLQKSSRYSLTVALEAQFYSDMEKSMNGENLKRPISVTQKELEDSVIEFLNGDDNSKLSNTLFQYIEDERIANFKPEGIAEALSKKEDPFEGEDFGYDTN